MKILPTVDPDRLRIEPKWRKIFEQDIARGFRHAEGKLRWEEPGLLVTVDAQEIISWFTEHCAGGTTDSPLHIAYDVETKPGGSFINWKKEQEEYFDPMLDKLTCVGFGTETHALVIPWLVPRPGGVKSAFAGPNHYSRVVSILRRFFLAESIVKVGWNSDSYDRMVIESRLNVTPAPTLDLMILHKLAYPDYRHGLAFAASMEPSIDPPAWKAEKEAAIESIGPTLWRYNGRDCCVTLKLRNPIERDCRKVGHWPQIERYRKLTDICVSMHKQGIRIDAERVRAHQIRLERIRRDTLTELRQHTASSFNPNSSSQVRELIYSTWELPLPDIRPGDLFTKTGDLSTGIPVMVGHLGNGVVVSEAQRHWIKTYIRYKRAEKLLTTNIRNWIGRDRMHSSWRATGTVGWRFSSSNMNMQNVKAVLRDCLVPDPGYVFVYLDKDALELKLICGLAARYGGGGYYRDIWERGGIDGHNATMCEIWGRENVLKIPGAPSDLRQKGADGSVFDRNRTLTKNITYLSLYRGAAGMVRRQLMMVEGKDANGEAEFTFASITQREVKAIQRKFLNAIKLGSWWDTQTNHWRRHGYVEEPIWGLRRFFPNGEDFNGIPNFPIQSGGAAILGDGLIECYDGELRGDNLVDGEGLAAQVHDAVYWQIREDRAEWAMAILNQAHNRKYEGIPVKFTGKAKVLTHM